MQNKNTYISLRDFVTILPLIFVTSYFSKYAIIFIGMN